MVTLGIDAHKRSHTVVAVDRQGRQLGIKTVGTNTKDHLGLLKWAEQFRDDDGVVWAVEDCVVCLAASSAICSGLVRQSCGFPRS